VKRAIKITLITLCVLSAPAFLLTVAYTIVLSVTMGSSRIAD
jgi:hypothetical protein